MRQRIMRSRAMARAAVAGLTLGLFALAALSLWSYSSTAQATSRVRTNGAVTSQWSEVFLHVSFESEALADYLRASSDVGREPLGNTIGSAKPNLDWLQQKAGPVEASNAASVQNSYDAYSYTLRELVKAGIRGDHAKVALYAQQASLSASTLSKQSVANMARKRLEMSQYLEVVDQRNAKLRWAATVVGVIDCLLLALCASVLLNHQRRLEGQAIENAHRSLHDGLTGLANRHLLGERMDQALRMAARRREHVGLLMLDLNRFKEVNDTLGHHHGDLLLCVVAERLAGAMRDGDTLARIGGDEFAVMLPGIESEQDALVAARRLLHLLNGPADLDGTVVDVDASIGVAVYPVHGAGTGAVGGGRGTELLKLADTAMYTAKRSNLGVALYQPPGSGLKSESDSSIDGALVV